MQIKSTTEISSSAPASSRTQRARILNLLLAARGAWVPLPEISALAAQYNARVFEARRLGFAIENRTEERDGVRLSWFRLVANPAQVASSTTPPAPGRASQTVSHDNSKSLSADPREQGTLPLFPEGNR